MIPTDPDSIEYILSTANIDWQEFYEERAIDLLGDRFREHYVE